MCSTSENNDRNLIKHRETVGQINFWSVLVGCQFYQKLTEAFSRYN